MIRRLPEILSIITVCCLVVMTAGCPTEPPEKHVDIDQISVPATALETPSPEKVNHRQAVRAAQPPADSPIGCVRDDR